MKTKDILESRGSVALCWCRWAPNQRYALVLIQDVQRRPTTVVVSVLDPHPGGDNIRVVLPEDLIGVVDLDMVQAAAQLFSYSWADINFEYDQLTDREKRAMPSVETHIKWMRLVETV